MPLTRNGPALTLCVALALAYRDVFCSDIFRSIDIYEAIVWCFAPVVILSTQYLWRSKQINQLIAKWRLILGVNLTATANLILYFYALKLADPVVVTIVFGAASWLTIYLIGDRSSQNPALDSLVMKFLAAIVLTSITISIVAGKPTDLASNTELAGVLLAIASASINSFGIRFERSLCAHRITPLAIVASRSVLLLMVSLIVAWESFNSWSAIYASPVLSVYWLLFPLVVLPVLVAQAAIANTQPITFKAIFALVPAMVLVLGTTSELVQYSDLNLLLVLVYTLVVLTGNYATGWRSSRAVEDLR